MRPFGTAQQLYQRRLRAIRLLQSGYRKAEVAWRVKAHESSIGRWATQHHAKGSESLLPQDVPGRPSKLSPTQSKALLRCLSKSSLAFGYVSDYWTLQRIRQLIMDKFQVRYRLNGVWYLLQRLGWSCQKPQRRAVQRDENEIAHWKRYVWPQIKKTHMTGVRPLFSLMKVESV
ncbi:MAG: transposase [Chloroflexi bacterium]|nr:transposase [Chloroflexota bacterium]